MLYCSLTCSHCSSLISFISSIDSRKQFSNEKFEKKKKKTTPKLKKTERVLLSCAPKVTFWFISFQMFFYIMCTHPLHILIHTFVCVCMSFQKWDCPFSSVCLFHIFIHYHSTLENAKTLLNIKT